MLIATASLSLMLCLTPCPLVCNPKLLGQQSTMKLSLLLVLPFTSAFAPATQGPQTTALNAQMGDRKAFLAAAGASIFAAVPLIANAGTMGQESVNDPTET